MAPKWIGLQRNQLPSFNSVYSLDLNNTHIRETSDRRLNQRSGRFCASGVVTVLDRRIVVLALLALIATSHVAHAQRMCAPRPIALFQSIKNRVDLLQATTRAPIQPARQLPICIGDTVRVGNESRAVVLMLESNTPLIIDQNSEFIITEATASRTSLVDLIRGALLFITRIPRSIEIRTPFVNAAIEGTEFVIRVETDRTVITVFEGAVRATNPQGTLLVRAGQQAVAVQGQAPQLQITVRPRNAVQWALYYEPVMPSDSFDQLAVVPANAQDSNFFARRAALLLGVGQIAQAGTDLDQALQLDPTNANAYAIRAIAAVATDDVDAALTNGRIAVERAPASAAAHIAFSYALQAASRLEDARDQMNEAVTSQSEDGPAWARLSELRLMLDDINGAVTASRRGVTLAPQAARAQVALGFAQLARLDLDAARAAFTRAVDLEPDHPLAHLGLGLTEIRKGRLGQGRGELELAVALDPENSLVRSYLGKAYFEERRPELTDEAFESAKRLDPMDPTPWFYSAIQKEASNRPVEALNELERSNRLNGNRAVYRSRLLLDQDLAVRGARLGRIYRDLGFQHRALAEGWKSLAIDPANYSAHRLLADSYLVLPRHGIARDSELLQAQLLQPLNINPVQPLAADNGLVVLSDTGPYSPGFNEYTRLFARNQVQLTADGAAGQSDTRADDVIVSGILNRLSYSAGQSHFDTDGVRPNDRLTQDIYNAFVQAAITPGTSAQIELRKNEFVQGDRRLLFDRTNFLPGQRSPVNISSVRLGGRKTVTPNDIVIGQYAHRALSASNDTGMGLRTTTAEDADFVEVRYLRGGRRASVTGGFGRYDGELTTSQIFGSIVRPPTTTATSHTNGYAYGTVQVARSVVATLGVSSDHLERGLLTRKQVNPKFGSIWNVTSRTTLRGAAFRALRRTVVTSQTIEPTEVAGFNQFFDDAVSTDAWQYGLGIDNAIGANWFAGAEASLRVLKVPIIPAGTRIPIDTDRQDQFATGYVNGTPTRWLAIAGDYTFEHLIREPNARNADLVANSMIHRVSAEARAFHANGLFVRFKESYVQQHGSFLNVRNVVFSGADTFWVADASAGYRLPRQMGVLSLEARNLFDGTFLYQDSSPSEPAILPVRVVTARLTFTF
jgi:tetratricopeptide (TPR) repeat protein